MGYLSVALLANFLSTSMQIYGANAFPNIEHISLSNFDFEYHLKWSPAMANKSTDVVTYNVIANIELWDENHTIKFYTAENPFLMFHDKDDYAYDQWTFTITASVNNTTIAQGTKEYFDLLVPSVPATLSPPIVKLAYECGNASLTARPPIPGLQASYLEFSVAFYGNITSGEYHIDSIKEIKPEVCAAYECLSVPGFNDSIDTSNENEGHGDNAGGSVINYDALVAGAVFVTLLMISTCVCLLKKCLYNPLKKQESELPETTKQVLGMIAEDEEIPEQTKILLDDKPAEELISKFVLNNGDGCLLYSDEREAILQDLIGFDEKENRAKIPSPTKRDQHYVTHLPVPFAIAKDPIVIRCDNASPYIAPPIVNPHDNDGYSAKPTLSEKVRESGKEMHKRIASVDSAFCDEHGSSEEINVVAVNTTVSTSFDDSCGVEGYVTLPNGLNTERD